MYAGACRQMAGVEIAAAQVQVDQLEEAERARLLRAKQPCPDPATKEESHAQEPGHGDICRAIDDRSKWVCPQICQLTPRKKVGLSLLKAPPETPSLVLWCPWLCHPFRWEL